MTPRPLSLEEALRLTPYENVKTLRRAYEAGELAVHQPRPGAMITVDPDELNRWLRRPREATTTKKIRSRIEKGRTADALRRPTTPSVEPLDIEERRGIPPRLTLADLKAA